MARKVTSALAATAMVTMVGSMSAPALATTIYDTMPAWDGSSFAAPFGNQIPLPTVKPLSRQVPTLFCKTLRSSCMVLQRSNCKRKSMLGPAIYWVVIQLKAPLALRSLQVRQ